MGAFTENVNHPNAQFKQLSKEPVVPKGSIFYTFLKIKLWKLSVCTMYIYYDN